MPNQSAVPVATPVSQASNSSRKRSRSPSESEALQPSKRQNKGATQGQSQAASSPDVPMSEAHDKPSNTTSSHTNNTTTASSVDIDKPKDLPAKPEVKDQTHGSSSSAPPVSTIHMRCLIVTQDASIIIGKAGSHVNEIREKSGAKVMVSESIPGNPERILNVSGALDAVSKASPHHNSRIC